MSKICEVCKKEIEDNSRVCKYCGNVVIDNISNKKTKKEETVTKQLPKSKEKHTRRNISIIIIILITTFLIIGIPYLVLYMWYYNNCGGLDPVYKLGSEEEKQHRTCDKVKKIINIHEDEDDKWKVQ